MHMLFKINDGDSRSFMYYKGEYYINGTVIELKNEYINTHCFNNKQLWKYARFDHQAEYNGSMVYFFCAAKLDWLSLRDMDLDIQIRKKYAQYFIIKPYEIDNVVDKIIKPIKLTKEESDSINNSIAEIIKNPNVDFVNPKLLVAWLIYIVMMICSLIFNQYYIIWIILSFIFFKYRKETLIK